MACPPAAVIQLYIESLCLTYSLLIAAVLEDEFGDGSQFVALFNLEVLRFLRDANLLPNALSGPLAESPFLKCLLHTWLKRLKLLSIYPNSSIQSCFLLRTDGK